MRLSHVVASVVAAVVFAAMALEATAFDETARWFPLFTAVAGAVVAVLAALTGCVAVFRRRRATPPTAQVPVGARSGRAHASPDSGATAPGGDLPPLGEENDTSELDSTGESTVMIAPGFGWLAVWTGYVLAVLVVGFIPASVAWVVIWFRTVRPWPWRVVALAAGIVLVLLLVAERYLNMGIPAGWGWIGEQL